MDPIEIIFKLKVYHIQFLPLFLYIVIHLARYISITLAASPPFLRTKFKIISKICQKSFPPLLISRNFDEFRSQVDLGKSTRLESTQVSREKSTWLDLSQSTGNAITNLKLNDFNFSLKQFCVKINKKNHSTYIDQFK